VILFVMIIRFVVDKDAEVGWIVVVVLKVDTIRRVVEVVTDPAGVVKLHVVQS
jgi:hypothetical protein